MNRQNISSEILVELRQLSCEDVAERLGIEVNRHKALCFVHDDHTPSLSFYGPNRNRWKCFACEASGSAIDMVMQYYNLDFVSACTWLCRQYGLPIGVDNSAFEPAFIPRVRPNSAPEEEGPRFDNEVGEWLFYNNRLGRVARQFLVNERKLDLYTIGRLGIVSLTNHNTIDKLLIKFGKDRLLQSGFVTERDDALYLRLFTPCLLIPYRDQDGQLVGVQSRYLGSGVNAPRFQFISGLRTRVFNLEILNVLSPGNRLYISEGITDCLALLSEGKKAVAIPSASILPHEDLLKLIPYKLFMYPDQDEAGDRAFHKLSDFFATHGGMLNRLPLPDGAKDYSDWHISKNLTTI